jgi:hypothetical protein
MNYACRILYAKNYLQNVLELGVLFLGACHLCVKSRYYRGADKSLARSGRKQATATEDFDVHVSYL